MKRKESKLWIATGILAFAALCPLYFVDDFKKANGQFHRDATHTYTDRICTGKISNATRVCTTYYFTEEQDKINKIVDKTHVIVVVLVLGVLSLTKIFNPSEKDRAREQAMKDPIGTAQTVWRETLEEIEVQRKDPNHGFGFAGLSKYQVFSGMILLFILFLIIGTYKEINFDTEGLLQKILKID